MFCGYYVHDLDESIHCSVIKCVFLKDFTWHYSKSNYIKPSYGLSGRYGSAASS